MEWSEGDGKWDNCNSIINKYILKKSETMIFFLNLEYFYKEKCPINSFLVTFRYNSYTEGKINS